ncbi:HAMP domain-containing sensor histidine kinase [Sphaerisporangium sp. NPDC005289]|uniref:sensor histidine kinase n=1 Tax=Sphaerisporangium sp. NPDC005289 TaxID=3155247 RepID=UPI0033B1F81F
MRRGRKHPSIRLRLTLVYAVVLVATCAALLALNYALLYQSLYTDSIGRRPPAGATGDASAGEDPLLRDEKTSAGDPARFDEIKQSGLDRLRADTLLKSAGTSAIALAVTAMLGLGVSWVVAGRMLRPLRTLTATTRRISQDRLHERVALTGPRGELKELADTFDEMVARLEASFNSQRRFVADASHELRTPLAIVRTGAEVLLGKRESTPAQWEAMAHNVLTAAGRAERLLDGLLALARSDSGVIAHEPYDLAVAAAVAVSEADDEAERARLDVTTDLRPALVDGDPVLLERLVRNLVDNAIRHNREGGWVEVTTGHGPANGREAIDGRYAVDGRDVADGRDMVDGRDVTYGRGMVDDRSMVDDRGAAGGVAVVTVRNSGDVIPPAEVDRLFEPFQRLASGRAAGSRSTGLGLAIVRSIVHAHGGTVTAAPNAEGSGLAVTVTLPASNRAEGEAARRR